MLVIGGANTVTGAVVGTFIVTAAYESLRGIEGLMNEAKVTSEPVIGLTEIVLALAMMAILVLRPGGLFPTREIGALLARRLGRQEKSG
jgi:branched-chain amino acid transport system permease protein